MYNAEKAQDERDNHIIDRIECLLMEGGECYPFSHDNIMEALCQTDSIWLTSSIQAAISMPENDFSQQSVSVIIRSICLEYWTGVARHIAENEPY